MIFVDNNGTTPLHPDVTLAMQPFISEAFGNPSSVHQIGNKARVAIEKARNQVAKALAVKPTEITFTGSGTESDNMAVLGTLLQSTRKKVVISAIEHVAVEKSALWAERFGFQCITVPFKVNQGQVDIQPFFDTFDDDVALVSVMMANNETGLVSPIADIFTAAHRYGIVCHTDAVQAFGKIPVQPEALGADLLSISAHKIHGPKGVGALYTKRGIKLEPIIHGGAQENGRRSGTESVANIVGLGTAVAGFSQEAIQHATHLRDTFEAKLLEHFGKRITIHHSDMQRTGNTSSVCFKGQDGNLLLIKLDSFGVCASTGSACHSGALTESKVLKAMGISSDTAKGTVRFSFSKLNTADEVEELLQVLKKVVR